MQAPSEFLDHEHAIRAERSIVSNLQEERRSRDSSAASRVTHMSVSLCIEVSSMVLAIDLLMTFT
jgi:hypothetical protein